MIIGFTGTRKGMTERQRDQLALMLTCFHSNMNTFHHGAGPGDRRQKADIEAAALAEHYGYTCQPHPAGDDPLKRDGEIVAAADILIAAPESDREELRSGTWATVRYARKAVKPVVMLSRGAGLLLALLLARPAAAQPRKVWTNADLGRPVAQWAPRRATPQELAWLQAHAYVPPPPAGDGPKVYVFGDGRPTLGPWEWPPEASEPPAPLSRDPYVYFPPVVPWYWPGQPLLAEPPRAPGREHRR